MLNRRRPDERARLGYRDPSRAGTALLTVAALAVLGVTALSMVLSGESGQHNAHPAAPPISTAADEGLAAVHDGFRLELLGKPAVRGPAVPVAFRILDAAGHPVTEYAPEQNRLLHLYVLRDDLAHYQHLHPRLRGDTWDAEISVPDGGRYRLYTEFRAKARLDPAHPTVLGAGFTVSGDTTFVPLPAPAPIVPAGTLTVSRADGLAPVPAQRPTELRFRITDPAGRPVDRLDPYLGAYGHLSAFNAITLGLLHQHPLGQSGGPDLTFTARFANRGEHRLFLEFSVDSQLRRAEFTIFVS